MPRSVLTLPPRRLFAHLRLLRLFLRPPRYSTELEVSAHKVGGDVNLISAPAFEHLSEISSSPKSKATVRSTDFRATFAVVFTLI